MGASLGVYTAVPAVEQNSFRISPRGCVISRVDTTGCCYLVSSIPGTWYLVDFKGHVDALCVGIRHPGLSVRYSGLIRSSLFTLACAHRKEQIDHVVASIFTLEGYILLYTSTWYCCTRTRSSCEEPQYTYLRSSDPTSLTLL